jgi:hypothetical protein
MDRLEALENVKAKTTEFYDYIQGGYLHKAKRPHEIDIVFPEATVPELDEAAMACEKIIDTVNALIVKEEKEIEDREAEEDPRDMMDETGHKDGDF